MPRFFVPPERLKNNRFLILGSEARHAAVVLRKKVGDVINLFDGLSLSCQGRIDTITPERVEGKIVSEIQTETTSGRLILCQALIKGPKWDWVVEKASEIGASQLIPLVTARTVVKPSGDKGMERSRRIAVASAKQCGRSSVMMISAPKPLAAVLQSVPKESTVLIPWEKEANISIRKAVSGKPVASLPIYVFIGPEGGWEEQEVELARRHGAVAVTLGKNLLRSETAGLVALALAQQEMGT